MCRDTTQTLEKNNLLKSSGQLQLHQKHKLQLRQLLRKLVCPRTGHYNHNLPNLQMESFCKKNLPKTTY